MTSRIPPDRALVALSVCLLGLVLVSGAATGAAGATDGTPTGPSESLGGIGGFGASGGESPPLQPATPSNNTSVQHENPDATSGRGDRNRVLQWLEGRLTAGLEGSILELSEGEYERAEGLLSEEWEDRLGQYVDVAGETDSPADDETADEVGETAETQRKYTRNVRQYRETLDQLRAAQAAGNQTAVRRYAHRLARLSGRVVRINRTLVQQYVVIANTTGRDLTTAIETATAITRNISTTQAEINESVFVRTQLSLRANRTSIAFTRPVQLRGTLRTLNGSGVADRTITLTIGSRDRTVRTGPDGAFAVTYRPVTIPRGQQTLAVRYQPAETAAYLGNRSAVAVTVDQVVGTLETTSPGGPYRFGDEVAIRGQVTVEGRTVSDVPLVVTLGDARLARGRTGEDGTTGLAGSIPAEIPAGTRSLRTELPWEDRAISVPATSSAVEVAPTGTAMEVMVSVDESVGLDVNGTLRTTAGEPVANQRVAISVASGAEVSVRTGDGGRFSTTIDAADLRSQDHNRSVTVAATFAGEGTNLEPSRDTASVVIPAALQGEGGGGDAGADSSGWPLALTIGIALVLVSVALLVLLWWRRQGTAERPEAQGTGDPAGAESHSERVPAPPTLLLRRARNLFEREDRAGTVAEAYAAVRAHLEGQYDLPDNLTHREFEAACYDRLEDADSQRFATVAQSYEQLVFAAEISPERARGALEAAEEVLG